MFRSWVILRENYPALYSAKVPLVIQCCTLKTSTHCPVPLKNVIPYGQYLRLHRNGSNNTLFNEEAGKLQSRLLARGYSRFCLWKAYNKTATKPRLDLLFKHKPKNYSNLDPTRIIMGFSGKHSAIKEIVQKHWTILTDDSRVSMFVSTNPSITSKEPLRLKITLSRVSLKVNRKEKKTSFSC